VNTTELSATGTGYIEAYSLNCEPFNDALDGRFFYASPALMQRLDLLTHLTQFGESTILVAGPHGSGKTSLLARFIGYAGKHWRLCLIDAEQFGQFRQRLGDALEIGDAGDEHLLLEQWAARSNVPELLVIVIDNAQELPVEAVQKLTALLDQPPADRVRLILFGTAEAVTTVKQTLGGNNMQLLEIPKLSAEDTAAYLMYRLAMAGYSGENPFTPTEVRAICKAADGRPANINRLAHDALTEHQIRAPGERLRTARTPRRKRRLAWGITALLALGAILYITWFRQQTGTLMDATANHQAPAFGQEIPLQLPESEPVATPAESRLPVPGHEANLIRPLSQNHPATEAAESHSPPPPQNFDIPAAPERPAAPAIEQAQPVSAQKQDVSAESVDPEPVAAEPATVVGPHPTIVKVEVPPGAAAIADPGPSVAAVEPTQPAPTSAETHDAASKETHREDWLLQQAPGDYSLQVLGSRHQQSIIDYIEHHHLPAGETAYYRGRYKDADWYVLMFGVFPSRQDALDARARLPARVRKENPWPRSMESVHAAIRAAQ
jgi:DamX protein